MFENRRLGKPRCVGRSGRSSIEDGAKYAISKLYVHAHEFGAVAADRSDGGLPDIEPVAASAIRVVVVAVAVTAICIASVITATVIVGDIEDPESSGRISKGLLHRKGLRVRHEDTREGPESSGCVSAGLRRRHGDLVHLVSGED